MYFTESIMGSLVNLNMADSDEWVFPAGLGVVVEIFYCFVSVELPPCCFVSVIVQWCN